MAKMSVLSNLIYTLNTILPESHKVVESVDKILLKFQWKGKGTRTAKRVLRKNTAGDVSYFRTYSHL